MGVSPAKAVTVSLICLVVLHLFEFVSGWASRFSESAWVDVGHIAILWMVFLLPGFVAGALTSEKPFLVGVSTAAAGTFVTALMTTLLTAYGWELIVYSMMTWQGLGGIVGYFLITIGVVYGVFYGRRYFNKGRDTHDLQDSEEGCP